MSIKLLKKLVKHEIKRFYVKNGIDKKKILFQSKGETETHISTVHFGTMTHQNFNKFFFLEIKQDINAKKLKYLVLLLYIQELLEEYE